MASATPVRGPASELPLGAHLVTPRGLYFHHGIHVGGGHVVHYAGFCETLRARPVEEVAIERFAAGREVRINQNVPSRYSATEVVACARSRVGQDRYRLLTNNCEHFSTWCLQGNARSAQVRACVVSLLLGVRVFLGLLKVHLAAASKRAPRAPRTPLPAAA